MGLPNTLLTPHFMDGFLLFLCMQKLALAAVLFLFSCTQEPEESVDLHTEVYRADTQVGASDTVYHILADTVYSTPDSGEVINTGATSPQQLVSFAQTLQNIPYKYGSVDPNVGFDCSGFVTYVFSHFGIKVPRSSVDFDNPALRSISLDKAKAGDLILFTGTDSLKRIVGHMGIIISKAHEPLAFIHSTSGKADGVTETPLNPYYQGRFMRVIRVFPQNDLN